MQKTILRNTTAVALSLSLAAPFPVAAQQGQGAEAPCAGLEGEARAECLADAGPAAGAESPQDADEAAQAPASQGAAPATGGTDTAEEAQPPAGSNAQDADVAPPAEQVERQPATEQADTTDAEAAPAAQDPAAQDPAAQDDATAATDGEPGAANGQAADAAAGAEVPAADEDAPAEPRTEAPATGGSETAADAPSDPQPEAPASDDAQTAAEAGTTPAAGDAATADGQTEAPESGETDTAADAETAPGAGDAATADAQSEAPAAEGAQTAADAEEATQATEDPAVADAEAPATESQPEDTAQGGDTAETPADTETAADGDRAAPVEGGDADQAAPAAAAAAGDDAEPAETVTETVTEEQARSSGEEFDTGIEEGMAEAAAREQDGDDAGLSDFQKFALGAAGLVGIGALIDQGEKVVAQTEDRVVVQRDDGDYYLLRDDNALIRRPGTEVETRTYSDGSTRIVATREDGTQIVTVRAPTGEVLRRTRILPDGRQVVLFDDTDPSQPVEIDALPRREARTVELDQTYTDRDLREALLAAELEGLDRRFSLAQIRDIEAVRNLVPALELEAITFPSGSAAIPPQEAEELAAIGTAMEEAIDENPGEVFLIEGYTDAVGAAPYNLALSDRRAESVALALTEYFDVPPENLVIQGYGETNLKVQTQEAERANRRVTVRRITPLLQSARAG